MMTVTFLNELIFFFLGILFTLIPKGIKFAWKYFWMSRRLKGAK